MPSRFALVQILVILPLLLAFSAVDAAANHDLTCHPPGGGNVFAVWVTVGFFGVTDEASPAGLFLEVGRKPEGAHAVVHDGTSNTVFVAETSGSASVACADVNGDGIAGITSISLTLETRRDGSRATISIVILPAETAEIDRSGWHAVRAQISDGRAPVQMEGKVLAVATSGGTLR